MAAHGGASVRQYAALARAPGVGKLPAVLSLPSHLRGDGRATVALSVLVHYGYGNVVDCDPSLADSAAEGEAPLLDPKSTSAFAEIA